jgi:MFS family permease
MAAVAGFLFGFDTVVISGTTEMLTRQFDLSKLMLGVTVSSALVGTVIGSLVADKPAEWLGRKPILLWLALLYLVSALGCGFAWSLLALLAFLFFAAMMLLQVVLAWRFLPETKRVSLEDMQRHLGIE